MSPDVDSICVILAGGKGNHLSVLSIERAKSAVPFGGFYRLIDFPLSYCVNSCIYDVGILNSVPTAFVNRAYWSWGAPWGHGPKKRRDRTPSAFIWEKPLEVVSWDRRMLFIRIELLLIEKDWIISWCFFRRSCLYDGL